MRLHNLLWQGNIEEREVRERKYFLIAEVVNYDD